MITADNVIQGFVAGFIFIFAILLLNGVQETLDEDDEVANAVIEKGKEGIISVNDGRILAGSVAFFVTLIVLAKKYNLI